MERRRFLRYAVTVPFAAVIACRSGGRRRRDSSLRTENHATRRRTCQVSPRLSGPGRVLVPLEWTTVSAVCARILPSDEDPGAAEAGVTGYIDAQLRHRVMSKHHPLLRRGVQLLQVAARKRYGRDFAALPTDAQDALVGELQLGRVGGRIGAAAFALLHRLTLEGFLCDPIYGGNRGKVGWKMIGFEPQAPAPRCPYEGRV